MAQVALIRCESYDQTRVYEAVKRGLMLLGGSDRIVKPGETILLKPNLLVAEPPHKCVTTHPSVFRAVALLLREAGAKLTFGDSPAFGSTTRVAKKAGLMAIADELGIELADFKNGESVSIEQALQNKQFVIAKGALACDGMVSLPKLKTHGLERYTGCVKNQFGCVPGMLKGEFHVKLPDAHQFGKMLVDLNNFLKPRLYVMDGIQAMEGNGPSGGKPKQMNVILVSTDPIALDATVCRLIEINPEFVPTVKYGMESGAGTFLSEEIQLLGDDFERLKCPSFDIKRKAIRGYDPKRGGITRFVNNRLVPKPAIKTETCTYCGTCIAMCPAQPKALDWLRELKDRSPVYNYDRCIRCYCCQEVCPEGAIELKKPVLRRLFGKG